MLLGTHVSIAGGYINALKEAQRLGIDTMQILTKNPRSWKEKVVDEEEGKEFRVAPKTRSQSYLRIPRGRGQVWVEKLRASRPS